MARIGPNGGAGVVFLDETQHDGLTAQVNVDLADGETYSDTGAFIGAYEPELHDIADGFGVDETDVSVHLYGPRSAVVRVRGLDPSPGS